MILKKQLQNVMLSPVLLWIVGLIAFLWVLFRTGTNPKRLTYPCQQAAFPIASAWVISFIPLIIVSQNFLFKNRIMLLSILGIILISGIVYKYKSYLLPPKEAVVLPVWENENAVSDIYIYENIPMSKGSLAAGDASVPDQYLYDPAIDSLVYMMSYGKTPFFKTHTIPNGIVGNDDVVILKCNFQWRHRLGTNTDRIKGVIWQILNHPDGFEGEVLVCDNQESQNGPSSWLSGFNDYSNNSDDENQSIVDVINTFKAKGYPVDFYAWDSLNIKIVAEYNQGDLTDGYIFNSETLTSYPKFKTPKGSYVSMSSGVWNSTSKTYNKDKLTIINFPVLKAHGIAGATIALKNYIGLMNTTKSEEWFGGIDNFHSNYCFSDYALVARELSIAWPDLNILDATYVATESNWNYKLETVHQQTVLASIDPVAISWYAAKYILTPLAENPLRTNPDLENGGSGDYSTILNYWCNYLKKNTEFPFAKTTATTSVYSLKNLFTNTAVVDEHLSEKVKIYPMPFNQELTILSKKFEHNELRVRVLDISGKVVYSENVDSYGDKIMINLSHLSSGSYILKIELQNNLFVSEKIVKH
jgi:hypothetical protein